MRRPKVLRRSDWDNPGRINIVVSKVVMALDVIEIHGIGYPIDLVKVTEVAAQVRIVNDPADVGLKMTMVNRVESDQRDEKPPVRFER
jgi:hypothetical protein